LQVTTVLFCCWPRHRCWPLPWEGLRALMDLIRTPQQRLPPMLRHRLTIRHPSTLQPPPPRHQSKLGFYLAYVARSYRQNYFDLFFLGTIRHQLTTQQRHRTRPPLMRHQAITLSQATTQPPQLQRTHRSTIRRLPTPPRRPSEYLKSL
jgi:hypothetical protein